MVCFFLALVLVLGNLPVTALAEQTPETEETVQTQTPETESTEGPEPIPETTGSSENSMIAVITEPAVTEEAVLTVYPLADAVVDENGTATFFVQAFGAAITYQWQVLDGTPDSADWKDVENAVGPELTISGLETDAAYPTRSYRCVVTSGNSRVTTNAAGIVSPADDGSANTVTAAASHTHPICGDVNCTEGHTNYTWTAWNGTSSISGTRFYLTQDATRTSYYTITGTVHICLNGHTLSTGGDAPGFSVSEGSTLLITDCQGTGEVCSDANTSSCSSTEVGIENEGGTFTLWNGTISGSYAGIDSIGGKVYIRGGSVQARDGQGIILEEDAALTMSDGSVSGSDAGILDFESTASASISGGSVSADFGQALSMRGAADISGGSFHGSTDICGNQLYLSGTPEFDSVWAYSALSLQNKAGTKSYTGGGFRLRSGVSGGSAAVVNVSDTGIASRITIYNGLYTGVAAGRLTASGTDLILQTPSSSGEAGDLLWALYGNGDFFLLGSGAMPNYSHPDQTSNQAPWKSVRSSIRSLYVSEGVTSIGSYAFYGSGLESVSFGSASLTLGNYCFAGCDSLKNIDFGSGTVSPGESVFSDCNALTSVTIPGTVVMNGQYSGAGSGYQLFFSCDSLETATVECGYIGPFVFEGCYQMKQATFTNPDVRFYFVDTGSGHPFHANSSQMNVAVTGCLCSQANVLVQKSEGRYNVNLTFTQIAGDTTRHTERVLPGVPAECEATGLTEGKDCSVCGYVFQEQETIPAPGHTEVVDEAVAATCTEDGLTEGKHCSVCGEVLVAQQIIPAPGHTGVIDEGVEATCTQDGLTEGKHCSVCGEILVKQEVIPADHCFEKGVCKYCGMMAGPCGANGDHLSYTLTVDGTLIILGSGEMMSFYGQGAPWYQSREKITTVILPEGLTSIGRYAFQDCVGLRQVALPQSVKQIEAFAFESCTALETIQFGDQLVTIGAYAFHDCDSLRSVDLPQSLTTLGSYAFFSCDNLEAAALPNGLKSIGTDCFYDCQKLQMIDMSAIPDVITEKNTLLTGKAVLPKALVQAAGGKANQSWTVRAVEGDETDPWSIASFTVLDGKTYLETMSSGSFVLETFDSHSGVKGSKVVQVQATTLIRPEGAIVLQGGDSIQLSVWRMPAGTELSARWSLAAGDQNYAELSDTGLLTAKFLAEPRTVTVTAEPEGGDSASATVRILPRSTGICIEQDGSILGETLDVDLAETDMLQFLAHVVPEGTAQEVCWSSSNLAVASEEETGAVTFISPGTAVIRASSAVDPDLYTEVTLRVFYLDAAEALKAAAQIPEIGLQPGQTARIVVSGEREIDASDLIFSIPPTQKSIASVDSQGILTAGNTPGTVTVTAALRGDPLARKATISVTVVPMQALALKLTPILPDQTASLEVRNGELIVAVSSAVLEEGDYTFGLSAQIRGYTGEWFPAGSLTWESTDGAMAAVTPGEGGTASVTIFQGAGGECAIQAAATDQAKVQSRIRICVRDNSPRLEASKLTLNSYRTSGATLGLLESYGNTIEEVRLYESDRLSDRFAGEADGAVLTLRATQTVKNGTYALRLEADCADGLTYSYPLQVKVANSLPAVTVKQTGKLNLFYLDSTVPLSVTAAGQAISGMPLTDTDDFTVEYTGGAAALRYSDAFRDSPAAKPDLRASLQVYLEDYRVPATAAITIGAVTTAPKLSLSPESSIINTALNPENPSAEIRVWDKTEGRYLDLSNAEVRYTADFAQITYWADTLTLTLTGGSGGTASIWIRQEGWTQSVKLTHKVTVSDKLPTLKLASSTLKLNNCFTRQTAETAVTLSQGNLTLSGMVITSTAKEGTAVAEEAGKLKVYYAPDAECLRAEIADPDNAPQAGNYTFSCRGVLSDGSEFPGGTLKVTVSNTLPKVKLSSTTLKLNRYLAGAEKVGAVVSVTGDPGYTVAGFEELNAGLYDWLIYDEGVLSVQLPDSNVALGKSSFRLTPVLRHEATGQEAALPTALTLTVQVYASDKLGVSLSAKGKLDTLDPDCAIDYTVSKLTNCSGSIDGVSLEGPDGDKFRALLDDSGAKPVIRLTLAEGEEYATNVTYKVRFNLTICGQDVLSPVMSFKVAQSALKLTASAKTLTLFQSQSVPLTCRLTLTAPAGAEIGDVSVGEKSSPELIAALGSDGFSAEINGGTAVISLSPEDTGALKAGKSYTLYLDVTPENNASNVKPSQVKLTVKVMK